MFFTEKVLQLGGLPLSGISQRKRTQWCYSPVVYSWTNKLTDNNEWGQPAELQE